MIINRQLGVRLSIAPLEEFLKQVLKLTSLRGDGLTVCLVSDAEIARWNWIYRRKRGPTDVLSFPASGEHRRRRPRRTQRRQGPRGTRRQTAAPSYGSSASGLAPASYLGDIAISPQAALRNARRFGRTFPEELRTLVLHGVLHLMGYDHETDHGKMDRRERQLRQRLGLY